MFLVLFCPMDEETKQLLLFGREHYGNHEFEKAEALLRQVLERNDKLADVHDMLGVICHARGNFAQAEHHFARALAINPAYTEAALNLAVIYNERGKYEAARAIYAQMKGGRASDANELDPFARGKLANMHAEVGNAYADVGLLNEAIGEYEKAIRLCPTFADLQTKLAGLFRQTGNHAKAREHYDAAIASRPSYIPARVQLGITLLALGDSSGAEATWRNVLEAEPTNLRAKMYLRMLETNR